MWSQDSTLEKVGSTEETQFIPPRKICHHCPVSHMGGWWDVLALLALSPKVKVISRILRLLLLMSKEVALHEARESLLSRTL